MALFEQIPDSIPGMVHGFVINEGVEPPGLFESTNVVEQPQHPGQLLFLLGPSQLPGQSLTEAADDPGMALFAEDSRGIRIELGNISVKGRRNR